MTDDDYLPVDVVAEMRAAAATLLKVSRLYGALVPEHYEWSAHRLLHEADVCEVPF